MKNFDYGNSSEFFKNAITTEIFENKIYEKFFSVEENDIVMDFGASIGPFTYSILDKKPKHVFCFEPSPEEFIVLNKNTLSGPVTCVNKAISSTNGKISNVNLFGNQDVFGDAFSLTFRDIIDYYNINKIDFLKTDCEGGEYDIFTEDNILWIKKNVKKIAGEWHLSTPEFKKKFKFFRDNILPYFDNYQIYSVDFIDIKWSLYSDTFIPYYNEIIVHIDNR